MSVVYGADGHDYVLIIGKIYCCLFASDSGYKGKQRLNEIWRVRQQVCNEGSFETR